MKQEETIKNNSYKLLKISSTAFENEGLIPSKYTCDGLNINPPLTIENIPEDAKCLVLIVNDPDAGIRPWVHWIVWNIPITNHIKENTIHGIEGINDFQQHQYGGPCPPAGMHHYIFKVYALNSLVNLSENSKIADLEKTMPAHIIAYGETIGLYHRQLKSK